MWLDDKDKEQVSRVWRYSPTDALDWPTFAEVSEASHEQLCLWWRFLPSADTDERREVQQKIHERFWVENPMTPEISKRIGWDPPP